MKKLLALSLITLTTGLTASEEEAPSFEYEPVYNHFFAPKAFWRNHKENGYTYKTGGFGMEYTLARDSGLNFNLSFLTNGFGGENLVESEAALSYKVLFDNNQTLYPILTTKSSSHRINRAIEKDFYIQKSTMSAGLGWENVFKDHLHVATEVHIFRDLQNNLIIQEPECFWGKSYSNPAGIKGKLGLSYKWSNRANISLESSYARTFKNCYKEFGLSTALKWGF